MDEEMIYVENTEQENEIEVEAGTGWAGGDIASHDALYGRDMDNQHPISAIIGLKGELNELEKLKTVYSNGVGVANYYKWNSGAHSEAGYFVSLVDTDKVALYDGSAPIFGVTVDEAGFVGNQAETITDNNDGLPPVHTYTRDNAYVLVATSGVVCVRCAANVAVGDHVVSGKDGCAITSTTGYGYKVMALSDNGYNAAVISLDIQADVIEEIGDNINVLNQKVQGNITNIAEAMRVATEALEMAESAGAASGVVPGIQDKIEDMDGKMEDLGTQIDNVAQDAAKHLDEAIKSTQEMCETAEKNANQALSDVGAMTAQLEPLTTWKDENGNIGAQYFVEYFDEFSGKTQVDIETMGTQINNNTSAISRSANEINSMVARVDKYSVGWYSQAYSLTLEQARQVLEPGMIYVPTGKETHFETYSYGSHKEKDGEGNDVDVTDYIQQPFTTGSMYVWEYVKHKVKIDGVETFEAVHEVDEWDENVAVEGAYYYVRSDKTYRYQKDGVWTSTMNSWDFGCLSGYLWNETLEMVWHNSLPPSEYTYNYWYCTENSEAYSKDTLYAKNDDGSWFAAATLAGNSSNRAVSMFNQTANSMSLEVTAASGAVASMEAKIEDFESRIQSGTVWPIGNEEYFLTTIEQTSSGDGSTVTLAATKTDGSKVPLNGASIVMSADQETSYIAFDADKINFETHRFNVTDKEENVLLSAGDGEVYIGGLTVGDGSMYNVVENAYIGSGDIEMLPAYMDTPQTVYFTENTYPSGYIDNSFVYVGADGIGLAHTSGQDVSTGEAIIDKQTWMSGGHLYSNSVEVSGKITATSGEIGKLAINADGLHNMVEYDHYTDDGLVSQRAYMNSHNTIDFGNAFWYECGDKSFVYVGGDGIGLMHTAIDATSSTRIVDKQTWLADGHLYTNSAEITGQSVIKECIIGDSIHNFTIGSDETNAAIYSKKLSLPAGLTGIADNEIYLGTDGVLLQNREGTADYNTMVRSNGIVCYGGSSGNNNRATYMSKGQIRFYSSGDMPFDNNGFNQNEIGSIDLTGIGDKNLRIWAANDMIVNAGGGNIAISASSGKLQLSAPYIEIGSKDTMNQNQELLGEWKCDTFEADYFSAGSADIYGGATITGNLTADSIDTDGVVKVGDHVTLVSGEIVRNNDYNEITILTVTLDGYTHDVIIRASAYDGTSSISVRKRV